LRLQTRSRGETHSGCEGGDRRVEKAAEELDTIEPELTESARQLDIKEADYSTLVHELAGLEAKVAERSARIDTLVRQLPPEEAELHRQRAELTTMRSRLETMRADLQRKRKAFRRFVDRESKAVVAHSDEIKRSFERYAEGFLLEQIGLVWSTQRSRIGQTGDLFEFPAFELDMTGTDFPSPVRRTGPEQVSESQREFIDLAFRMALMEVAGGDGVGSLVQRFRNSNHIALIVGWAKSPGTADVTALAATRFCPRGPTKPHASRPRGQRRAPPSRTRPAVPGAFAHPTYDWFHGIGRLVIDAPESSLDAVFVTRAAKVLARFAKPSKGNRLLITSNLVEGKLIPELLTMSSLPGKRLSRLVNLFNVAEPTAATRKLNQEYQQVMSELIGKVEDKAAKKTPAPKSPVRRRRT
jgi:hypothetical protein